MNLNFVGRWQDAGRRRWRSAKQRYRWLDHAVVAWVRFRDNHGNHFAAAITYFSFLALFPLVLLAVSVLGFVLQRNQDLLNTILDNITANIPGAFGDTLKSSINAAIRARTSVGILALGGLLLTGLGWIGNLRAAINEMWGVTPPAKNFFQAKLANLVVLVGLGLGAIVSIGLTVLGSAFTDKILQAAGLDHVAGVPLLARVFGLAVAVVGDTLIFAWLVVRLPAADTPAGLAFRGGLLGAVGFEALKIIGAYYIARVTQTPTVGIFGSVIGVLVWIYLVARYLLYCAAWTATASLPAQVAPAGPTVPGPPAAIGPSAEPPTPWILSPVGIATAVFSAGVAAGGAGVAWLKSRRRRYRT